MVKYMLLYIREREITKPRFFDTWEDAFKRMSNEVIEELPYTPDDLPEDMLECICKSGEYTDDDSFGIFRKSAWLNTSDNHDWSIFRVRVNGNRINIK